MADRKTLASLFFVVFLDLLGIGIVYPLLPIIFLDINFGFANPALQNILLGFLVASYPLSQFIGAPILGKLSDKHGRKKVLVISLFGSAVGYALFALGIYYANIYMLFASRMLDGFTGGNISVALSAIADISKTEKEKVNNFGILGMAFGLGFILGPFVGGVMADSSVVSWFNATTPFLFAALVALINMIFIHFYFKETLKKKLKGKVKVLQGFFDIKKAFTMKGVSVILITVFMLNFGWSFYTQFFQVYVVEKFAYSLVELGLLFAYIGIWISIAQGIIIRPFSARYSPDLLLRRALITTAFFILIFVFLNRAWIMYAVIPFLAIAFGFTQPSVSTLLSTAVAKENQGEIMGIRQSVVSLAQAVPPVIAGFSINFYIGMPILLGAVSILIAALIFSHFHRGRQVHF